jgi:hypothetical protein
MLKNCGLNPDSLEINGKDGKIVIKPSRLPKQNSE